MAETKLGHRPGLDGLRGVAVLVVVVAHALRVDRGGQVGVTIFFVLSGFLITSLLLERPGLRGFYGRRVRRLLPALIGLLAVLLVAGVASVSDLGPSLLYYANWSVISNPGQLGASMGHLWSLAIEEQFYVVWPAVLMAVRHARRERIAVVVIGVAVLSAGLRFVLWGDGYSRVMYGSDTRVEAMLIGCAAALLLPLLPVPSRKVAGYATVLLAVLAVMEQQTFAFATAGLTLCALAALVVLLGALERPGVLASRPLRHFGKISYGLYLIHVPVLVAARGHGPMWTLAGVGVSWGSAVLSYRFFETRFTLRRRAEVLGPDAEDVGSGREQGEVRCGAGLVAQPERHVAAGDVARLHRVEDPARDDLVVAGDDRFL